MVYLYDEAVVQKFNNWTEETNVTILSPDDTRRTFEILGDKNNDEEIKLPLICIRRIGGYKLLNDNKKPMTYSGMTIDVDIDGNTTQINAIPIDIQYQVDIYTRYMKEADVYARDLIFGIINYPTVNVTIPFNSIDYLTHCTLRLSEDVKDNSDIPELFVPGQVSRLSLEMYLDDAYLYSIPQGKAVSFTDENSLMIYSGENDVISEKLI